MPRVNHVKQAQAVIAELKGAFWRVREPSSRLLRVTPHTLVFLVVLDLLTCGLIALAQS